MRQLKSREVVDALAALKRRSGFFFVVTAGVNLTLLASSIYMWQVFDRVLRSGSIPTLIYLTVFAVLALVVSAALDVTRRRALNRTGVWLEAKLAPRLIEASLAAKVRGGDARGLGLGETGQLRAFLSGEAVITAFDAPSFPVFAGLIWLIHPVLGAITVLGAAALVAMAWINDRQGRTSKAADADFAKVRASAEDAVAAARAVSAMGMVGAVRERWRMGAARYAGEAIEASDRQATWSAAARGLRLALQIGVIGAGAALVLSGALTAGGMLASSILLARALSPAERAIGSWRSFETAVAALLRIDAILAAAPEPSTKLSLPEPRGALAVEGLVAGHPGAKTPALRGISFSLAPGEFCLVIGPTGAGKSTLLSLLAGGSPPAGGRVRLDDVAFDEWPREELGRHIGYAPQEAELTAGSVSETIARWRVPDPEAVIEAATRAGAHAMIAHLASGYDTEIGPGGARLSGGQRQRIALARALYGRPKLLVLDEAEAHLDDAGRQALVAVLTMLKREGVTIVMATHSRFVVHLADKVAYLDDGVLVAFGAPDAVQREVRARAQAAEPSKAGALRAVRTAGGDA